MVGGQGDYFLISNPVIYESLQTIFQKLAHDLNVRYIDIKTGMFKMAAPRMMCQRTWGRS